MAFQTAIARRLLFSLALVAASTAFAVPAAASTRGRATGTFIFLQDTRTPVGEADGSQLLKEVATISYTGDLTGIASATDKLIVHADGSVNGHGTESCHSCTIGGRTGSFTAHFTFHGSAGQISGRETFIAGTGGLAGLHGGGRFQGSPTGNTYSYHYVFTRRAAPTQASVLNSLTPAGRRYVLGILSLSPAQLRAAYGTTGES
jgi:Protein of unknown function (DUF3224)